MRGKPKTTYETYLGAAPTPAIYLQATAHWKSDTSSSCDSMLKSREEAVLLQLGTKAAVPYNLNGSNFGRWIGTKDETAVGPKFLAILTLGWSYVLSAQMVEIQGSGAAMTYTQSTAETELNTSPETATTAIDLGEIDEDGSSQTDIAEPFSSRKAFDALAQFALTHNLGSQFLIAFATAMTIPTHNYHGSTLQLPHMTRTGAQCPATPASSIPVEWTDLYESPYLDGKQNDQIWRADIWRLLHPPTAEEDDMSYNYRPRTPWVPCGKMPKENCSLRVASHLNCPRHHLQYHHLTWQLEDDIIIDDPGLPRPTAPALTTLDTDRLQIGDLHQAPQIEVDQDASWSASSDLFRWFVTNGEGFPPEKIYKDEWLQGLEDDDDDDDDIEDEKEDDETDPKRPRQEGQLGLDNWLDTIE
ncbi:hypothetical protein BO70DRAFT_427063 [Aspergillus heteromorphus CBS 117.55]|uniref:Uncharacterized protein n=1 Tax=Aspergillus heteromorphus CBS 117.55 TaxID=1448321 RepID=A0A317WVE8_9EURO|nr:uncharacterized protein BO70DRAFT_427063 [Aspergillus heteromorphus CBS 117.55]PWY88250.1 hypothetical protein BO70DRAFT_427063 [Aspergillus heteromorphus CBS 117.55]